MKRHAKCIVFLLIFTLAAFSLFAGGKGEEAKPAEEGGKKYDGVELTFLIQGGAAYDIANEKGQTFLQAMAEEFKEETGATVRIVGAPWENLMPKIMNDVTTGANQYDGMLFDIEFQYSIYPYLYKIQPLIEKTGYDMDGFVQPVYKYGEWAGEGNRYGLPMTSSIMPILYRTDIVDSIPDNWDDYYDMLDEIKASGDVKYPVTIPGVSAQLVKRFLAYFWSTGDVTIDKAWNPRINNKNGLWAIKELDKLIKNYCPPGTLGYDNPDAANIFMNGEAALYENWLAFILPSLRNPEENEKVRGKWDLGKFPEGGTGNYVQHNFIVMKASKNPEATFDYIAKCTSEEGQKRAILEFGIDISRASVMNDPDVKKEHPYYSSYAEVLNAGRPMFPGVPYWLELFMGLGEGLGKYFSGEVTDPQEALDLIAGKWRTVIDENPLDFEYTE